MRPLRPLLALIVVTACGGAQVESPAVAPADRTGSATAPTRSAPAERDPYEGLIWYVHWEGIHCLTIYPSPGLVRSAQPDQASATFRSRSPHFSIISAYYYREDAWAPVIDQATSIDDLLQRLRALDDVTVEEALNPVQTHGAW